MTDTPLRPRFISFDCSGTLARFCMSELDETLCADRIDAARMPAFTRGFARYRLDAVPDAWKPDREVIGNAPRRACTRHGAPHREEDAAVSAAVPTWGPHPDVAAGPTRIAGRIPLVILSKAMEDEIGRDVGLLGAPFHRIYTAEGAQADKPCVQAFEHRLDRPGMAPEDGMPVSSRHRYDRTHRIDDNGGLPAPVGLGEDLT